MKSKNDFQDKAYFALAKLSFGVSKRLALYEQIMAMMEEGIPIVDVISDLETIYKSENKNDFRVYILGRWRKAMTHSGSLLKEIKFWIPEAEVVMFKTAEETGQWADCLKNLIFQVEKQAEIKKVVLGQMGYPIFLGIFLLAILYGFGAKGVPMLLGMLPLEMWPGMSMPLYHISTFISDYILLVLLGIVAFLIFLFQVQNKYVGNGRNSLDKFPPFSIYKAMQGASFLISLASLLRSGIPVIDAVAIIEGSSSPWMKKKIKKINSAFNTGDTGASALIVGGENSMFGKEVRIQIKAFSGLSQMDKSIYTIGIRAIDITANYVKNMTGVIKMAMMFFVATCIIWIYASFIQVAQLASNAV